MPRKMSFFLTKKQFVDRTKTVTRRIGWKHLKPGDVVMGAEKCMGLKKGEKVVDLGLIRILGNRREPLNAITLDDVKMEGFPEMSTSQFIAFFLRESGGWGPMVEVSRIEFEYLDEQPKGEMQ